MKTIKELNAEYDMLCSKLALVDRDLSEVSDISYIWSLLVQEKSRLQTLIKDNTLECDKVYMAQRNEVTKVV